MYHRIGGLNNTQFSLPVLEPGKSKIKVLADPVSGKSPLSGSQMVAFSLYPHVMERNQLSSVKGPSPIIRAPPS